MPRSTSSAITSIVVERVKPHSRHRIGGREDGRIPREAGDGREIRLPLRGGGERADCEF